MPMWKREVAPVSVPPGERLKRADIGELAIDIVGCQCGRKVAPESLPPGKRLKCADIGELAIDIAGCQCGREVAPDVRAARQAPDVRTLVS